MSDTTVVPPAPLLPPADLVTFALSLLDDVTGAAGASAGRDTFQVQQVIRAALDRVAVQLDQIAPYATTADVPARIREAVIQLAVVYLHRIRVATGPAAYDDPDPMGVRAEGVILSSISPGQKARWGLA
jgi:hypothetical protein